jgi:hypothetical protein
MSSFITVLMHTNGERFELGSTPDLASYFSTTPRDLSQIDPQQSRALAFGSEAQAAAALAALCRPLQPWRLAATKRAAAAHWFNSSAMLELHRRIAVLCATGAELVRVDQFLPVTDESLDLEAGENAQAILEDRSSENAKAFAPAALLPAVLVALRSLRRLCGENLALLPTFTSTPQSQATHELIGTFGADDFSAAVAALGVLELDLDHVFFAGHECSELNQTGTTLEWVFSVKIIRPTVAQLSHSDSRAQARLALARADLQIPGWDSPIVDELVMDAVRATHFETAQPVLASGNTSGATLPARLRQVG